MAYALLKFAHILGAVLIGAGLVGVWLADLRSRQVQELGAFAEAVRYIGVFYDGLVIPGAFLLLTSGTWLIVQFFGGWNFLEVPWLLGMVGLFLFELVEGNTVTRVYFRRLRRLTLEALSEGTITRELERARAQSIPAFTHFLDFPILLVIIALGSLRPESWTLFFFGCVLALSIAAALTLYIPRLYPSGRG